MAAKLSRKDNKFSFLNDGEAAYEIAWHQMLKFDFLLGPNAMTKAVIRKRNPPEHLLSL